MPYKLLKRFSNIISKNFWNLFFFILSGGFSNSAFAINVSPLHAGATVDNTTYFASTPLAGSSFLDSTKFYLYDLTKKNSNESNGSRDSMIVLEVKSDVDFSPDTGESLVITIIADNSGTDIYVPISSVEGANIDPSDLKDCKIGGVDQGNCQSSIGGTNLYYAAKYTEKSIMRVGFYPLDLCSQSSIPLLCNGAVVNDVNASSFAVVTLRVSIHVASSTGHLALSDDAKDESDEFKIRFTAASPALERCEYSELYFPGDSEIKFDSTKIISSTVSAGAPVKTIIVAGHRSTDTARISDSDFRNRNEIVSEVATGSGKVLIKGFQNTTDGSNNAYRVEFGVRDAAGIIPLNTCALSGVMTSEIQGFLNKSNCFISTVVMPFAANPFVPILQKFRDRVLLNIPFGNKLVSWYYSWGKSAANWVIKNPYFQMPLLVIVSLLTLFASQLLFPAFLGLYLVLFWWMRAR